MSAQAIRDLMMKLREARQRNLDLIARFTPEDLSALTEIRNRTLRGMIWMMAEHYSVHQTQIYNNRIAAGDRSDEINTLLAQAQASFGDVLSHVIDVDERTAEFAPDAEEWSIREILEHLLEFELRYQQEFERLSQEKGTGR